MNDCADDLPALCQTLGCSVDDLGVMIVDHGSRREESNHALLRVMEMFQREASFARVRPAHMELAEPSIATAFTQLVADGARFVIVYPYFLLPGRHWAEDIPALAQAAAAAHPGVGYLVTAPLGIHPLMARIMQDRIMQCLRHVANDGDSCDFCEQTGVCDRGQSIP